MEIKSTDASNVALKLPEKKPVTKDNNMQNPVDNKLISQMTPLEKNELPISEKVVIDAIEKANKAISGANTRVQFSIHKQTKQIVVKVINSDTNEVIREIPPEKILDMVAEMCGILVDERR